MESLSDHSSPPPLIKDIRVSVILPLRVEEDRDFRVIETDGFIFFPFHYGSEWSALFIPKEDT
jgi:hypothetical protein